MPRIVLAVQRIAVAAYGAAADKASARRPAAIFSHSSSAGFPTMGTVPSHSGGAGMVNDVSVVAQSTITPALETIVPMASSSGRTTSSSNAPVMATTANVRLPHSHACRYRMTGHVATTIIEAQMIAPRKGRRIQIVNVIRTTMIRTPSVARGTSVGESVAVSIILTLPIVCRGCGQNRDRQARALHHVSCRSRARREIQISGPEQQRWRVCWGRP